MSKKAAAYSTTLVDAAAMGLTYVGTDGAHIGGIPAHSLSPAEVALLSAEQVDACLKSHLYEVMNYES
jgi:hypothetical protein